MSLAVVERLNGLNGLNDWNVLDHHWNFWNDWNLWNGLRLRIGLEPGGVLVLEK
ncbi:MAG TPA: hypothetical protein VMR20_15975 [Verrucomicrobiae bacterium]|nr:hypothetical protein [Verrucomicrobiae bacterium]